MSGNKPKRTNRFEMRLNDEEMEKLQRNAEARGLSVSEFVRDWIKSLPQENRTGS